MAESVTSALFQIFYERYQPQPTGNDGSEFILGLVIFQILLINMCNSCHEVLEHYIGTPTLFGYVVHAWTMLHPRNDMFVIRMENDKLKKYRRVELGLYSDERGKSVIEEALNDPEILNPLYPHNVAGK
jgi:hypothetical protein